MPGPKHRDAIARTIKPIYTALTAAAAAEALDAFDAEWGHRYPAVLAQRMPRAHTVPRLRHRSPKVDLLDEAIESLTARYRRSERARGHFPHEQPALLCLYLVTRSIDPAGSGQKRWTMRWTPALNVFAVPSLTACRPARTTNRKRLSTRKSDTRIPDFTENVVRRCSSVCFAAQTGA
ncbi:transposase [Gordonia terrae]